MGQLRKLQYVYLNNNQFEGTLPESWGETCPTLLNLGNNSLSGTIPESFGDCTGIVGFYMNDNHLSGALPDFLVTAPDFFVDVRNNELTCPLPRWCSSLGSGYCEPCAFA
mmetsp:Transcript_18018/g.69752  ORF Transcript_18018/g.69752 Transcript_18018/m.69752 type:complete len:110 (+) Transcript_18018:926-1255(+)